MSKEAADRAFRMRAMDEHADLPTAYRLWADRGYLTAASPRYLWVWDAEWLPPAEIPGDQLRAFAHVPGLIPFAFNGCADYWCWHRELPTEPGEYRILLCPHDDPMAEVDAPTFAGWFYRRCLDFACSVDDDLPSIRHASRHLGVWAERLRELTRQDWADDIGRLADGTPFRYVWGRRAMPDFGFLTYDQANRRVEQAFGQGYIDQEVPWLRMPERG